MTVLAPDHHVSYPFVFARGGEIDATAGVEVIDGFRFARRR